MHIYEICENFTNTFINFCKICILFNKVLIRPNDKPWFTSELRYNIRLRDRLHVRKHSFKTPNEIDKIRYKTQRNHVNNMKKYGKENYNNNLETIISSKDKGNKTFWQVM